MSKFNASRPLSNSLYINVMYCYLVSVQCILITSKPFCTKRYLLQSTAESLVHCGRKMKDKCSQKKQTYIMVHATDINLIVLCPITLVQSYGIFYMCHGIENGPLHN